MDKVKPRPRISFGWWTVLITGVISGLGHGFYGYGFSVFFKDLAAFTLFAILITVSTGLLCFVRPPKAPAEVTGALGAR